MSGLGFTHWGASVAIAFGVSFCTIDYAKAQITPDGTLPNNSSVTREGDTFNITGGTQAGGNLFHSFGEFSVPTGSTADFNNALDIQNIITRVTGESVSNIDIDGLIRTLGTANLFLTNPNGIVFGENASLNVGGSFVATSANALQFGNGGFFSATDKNIPSELLTVNPSALLFNQINQNGGIQNNSVAPAGTDPAGFNAFGLRVPDGKSLLLVGGNVSMDGGRLNAYGGRAELGGLAQAGTVALGVNGDSLSLIFPDNAALTSVSLTNQAGVIVTGAGGGNIAVNARNLEILGGSLLSAGIGEGLGTPETVAGDIMLNATESIKVAGTGSNVRNLVGLGSLGNGGNITIDSGSLSLQNGAQLIASTSGLGNAGNVTVQAIDAVTLADADILSTVSAGGVGKGGNIDILAATLSLIDGAQLATITREASDTQPAGRGDAGNVNVNVRGIVNISGEKNGIQSGIGSFVGTGTVGNGGNITINSGSFSLSDGAQLSASTSGLGNAGAIKVNATDFFTISDSSSNINSGLFANSQSTTGTARDIIVTSPRVTLDNSSGLNAESSSGNGGNISLQTDLLLLRGGAQIPTSAGTAQVGGDGGNISINTSGILIAVKPVPEPTLPLSVFALTAFYAAWRLKRKQEQTHELKA
ncbi:filamentous hemagglutinin N-terminal domain-containing protein [Nostoc commune]|uniref:two-partner secretion domain-containing protein n=1 Tax=Nostoc commune TaxID=1178 RepID=UPI0018C757D7|nr:filamentous hemagglutinin N-terminal domain-containing protein [Nostoc commune]MBG1262272.1 filamentous hemagglutinin N-terminal domain-containing protein [Nostoc commune BAE]